MSQVYLEEEEKGKRKKIIIFIAIFVAALLIIGAYYRFLKRPKVTATPETAKASELNIIYPVSRFRLAKKTVQIKNETPERTKIDIMMKALKDEKAIPERLELYDYTIDSNGIIYTNLSGHLIEDINEPSQEIMALYSIINTLISNTGNAKAVQILIEGRPVYTLKGLIYTYKPLPYNNDLMED
ncbi:MAG: GerMN domain-containing protein [Syntrophorhabdaceae bacterium]|nr:GerMN domain-containing protein [Syntrophorhabdaceae bacterium]